MRKARGRKTQSNISRAIFTSAVLHLIAILFIIFIPANLSIAPEHEPDVVWIELPKGTGEDFEAIKEVKRLPETIKEEIKPIKPLPKDKKVMREPKKKKKKIVKKPRKSSLNKALAKIDKKLKDREVAQPKTTGTGFEHGTSDKPLKDQNYHTALLKYRALVKARIRRQWIPPTNLGSTRPVVRITVFISKSGNVLSTTWAKRSGNEAFNQSALRAVRRASPFPIPPAPLKWEAYKEGFSVVFNPPNR